MLFIYQHIHGHEAVQIIASVSDLFDSLRPKFFLDFGRNLAKLLYIRAVFEFLDRDAIVKVNTHVIHLD